MICSRCNKLNNDSAKFCRYCGNELIEPEYYEDDEYYDDNYEISRSTRRTGNSYLDEIDRLKDAAVDGLSKVTDNMGDFKYIAMDGLDKAKDIAWNLKEAAGNGIASVKDSYGRNQDKQRSSGKKKSASPLGKIAVPAIAAVVVVLLILLLRGSTINLNKYLEFEVSGTNGEGYVYISLDTDKLAKKLTGKVKLTAEGREMMGSSYDKEELAEDVAEFYGYLIEADNTYGLSNGDKVKYYWEKPDEFSQAMFDGLYNVKCNIKYKDGVYTVKGLK